MHLPDHNDDQHEYDRGTVRQLPLAVFCRVRALVVGGKFLHLGVWLLHAAHRDRRAVCQLRRTVRHNHDDDLDDDFDQHHDRGTVRRLLLEMERLRMVSLSV